MSRILILTGFFILITFPMNARGINVSGVVTDQDNNGPVQYVTVYINGSTIGTITDQDGVFKLTGFSVPCELILSHVSYELQRFEIKDTSGLSMISFELNKKIVQLEEVTVILDSARQEYLSRFKAWFLGKDYAATGADILNGNVLSFIPLEGDQFEAYAMEPLLINLPKTGYLLKTDLVHFRLKQNAELERYHCSILGYFYFEKIEYGSRGQQRNIARNRVKTYYNSRFHFCRSLYENKLKENGYNLEMISMNTDKDSLPGLVEPDYSYWYSDEVSGNPVLNLSDFTSTAFRIKYYHKSGNKPVDLTYLYAHPSKLSYSRLYFLNDTVRIFSSGWVGENSVSFSGAIGDKGVAWMLPEDYIPSMR